MMIVDVSIHLNASTKLPSPEVFKRSTYSYSLGYEMISQLGLRIQWVNINTKIFAIFFLIKKPENRKNCIHIYITKENIFPHRVSALVKDAQLGVPWQDKPVGTQTMTLMLKMRPCCMEPSMLSCCLCQ